MCTQYMDELVREYLLHRGFVSTIKAFDTDLKNDKDKAFRADKIVDQFAQYIVLGDLTGVRELWSHLDQHIFIKCAQPTTLGVKKMEYSLLKMYLVGAVTSGKTDKVVEFFERLGWEIQNNPEWKDWFALPFTKNPEESSTFAVYFTKHWQDTVFISLHNLLAITFQSVPQPTLLAYSEESVKMSRLQVENEQLQNKLRGNAAESSQDVGCSISIDSLPAGLELVDDFGLVAQDASPLDLGSRSFRNFIRGFGSTSGGSLNTSPLANRRGQSASPSPIKPT